MITLHLSYLGYKSIKVRVTGDWIKYGTSTTIEMTELALALEEVVVNQLNLTGYLEIDIKQVPLQKISAIVFQAYRLRVMKGVKALPMP